MGTPVSSPQLSVILPTYNEVENLPLIVPQVAQAFEAMRIRGAILVVDDDSPDGTADKARELSARYPVQVAVRKVRGLATAVIHGFSLSDSPYIAVMDADLSHPVSALSLLVAALQTKLCDLAVGSRYVPGGETVHWTSGRRINSRVATWLCRPLCALSDPMAGFFVFRRELLQGVSLRPIGYKILLEIVVKCRVKRIEEIPIVFRNREHGQSKLNGKEQLNYLRHLGRLYAWRMANR